MSSDGKQESERWLEELAGCLGISGGDEHHPDLGPGLKRPDYRLARDGAAAICEVKEFRTTAITDRLMAAPRQTAALSDKEQFGTVRDAISKAAAQLKPYRDRGDALVVVLANPHNADVSLAPGDVIAAMYGNPGVRVTIDEGSGSAVDDTPMLLRDGVLTAKHQYVSAVVTLNRHYEAEDYLDAWREEYRRRHGRPVPGDEAAIVRYSEAIATERESGRVPTGSYVYANIFDTVTSATGDARLLQRALLETPRTQHFSFDPASCTYGLTNRE